MPGIRSVLRSAWHKLTRTDPVVNLPQGHFFRGLALGLVGGRDVCVAERPLSSLLYRPRTILIL